MWQSWMKWKMPLCNWHTFWMAPSLICFFIVVFFSIERKWLLMRSLATILPLKSKLSRKFQRFNTLDRFSIKMKNCKTLYEVQTASHLKEIFQSPPPQPTPHQIKSYYVSGTKILLRRYTEIYRHLLSRCFKNAVLGRQEMMQCKCYFLRQIETCLLENL